ncbi:MAG TPA: HAD family hydrolase [Acidimicrobiia bacterium]|nr:HAD family hydrolase [Acidimicrobiia bacterium]
MGEPRFEAVTFDYWNTLCWEEVGHLRGLRIEAWAGLLQEAGFAVERTLLDAVFDDSWKRFTDRWTANQQYKAAEAAEEMLERLGFAVPDPVARALVREFSDVGHRAQLHLTDGVADCLRALHGAGVRLGIICDVGMTASTILRAHLDRHGVLELFDHWSFSDEVGHYKPSPVIFEHALEGLGVAPERALHIGDIRRTDVAGAQAMGMTAVRYTGISDDQTQETPEGDFVIGHHAELPAIVLGG